MENDDDLSTVAAPPVAAECRVLVSQSRSQKTKQLAVVPVQAMPTEPPASSAPAPIDREKNFDSHTSKRGPHSF